MTQNTLEHEFATLVADTDLLLWKSYHAAIHHVASPCQLLFPLKSDQTVRVSEQEAKQLFIKRLHTSPFCYSVETPTLRKYSPSKKGERSAMTDLTLYSAGERFLNIEFKAGNTSKHRENRKHISKDIEKLVLEHVDGFWFHILERANGNGIETIWQTIRHELKTVTQSGRQFNTKRITFHCCVLQEAYSVETTLVLNDDAYRPDWLTNLMRPNIDVSRGKLNALQKAEGWIVRSYQPSTDQIEGF